MPKPAWARNHSKLKFRKMKKLVGMTLIALMCGFKANHFLNVSGKVIDDQNSQPVAGVAIVVKGTDIGTTSNKDGKFSIAVPSKGGVLIFSAVDYKEKQLAVTRDNPNLIVKLTSLVPRIETPPVEEELSMDMEVLEEVVMEMPMTAQPQHKRANKMMSQGAAHRVIGDFSYPQPHNTEEYDAIQENVFHDPRNSPLSTFSIDVDAASYSNMRRMINAGQKPYKDAVRIEEMVNYFSYDYPAPEGEHPFSITTEVAQAPWNKKHRLVHIGLQGKKLDYENTDPCNLVFLVDVSGSMSDHNKLPLLKSSLKLLVDQLNVHDKIAIVAYAGAAGLVLPSTPASEKQTIISALDRLKSGGSTAGGEGIRLAYTVAEQNLIKNGNNRVVLATDGDFNVGVSSTSEMVRLIEEKRKSGIFLTITGFGMGNYKDGRMEQISNAGNGNYYYIDNISEARKVFVTEMQATLFTIAKDVKIQVEFNPAKVQAYRLIGYENRKLNDEDFNNDRKDAGELGAGHTVTALYEVIPAGVESEFTQDVDDLKYQNRADSKKIDSDELLTVKFRYKEPNGSRSKLIATTLKDKGLDINKSSDNFRFSASVAEFGMLVRESEFKQQSSYQNAITLALGAKGKDTEGHRQEFINLVRSMELLDKGQL